MRRKWSQTRKCRASWAKLRRTSAFTLSPIKFFAILQVASCNSTVPILTGSDQLLHWESSLGESSKTMAPLGRWVILIQQRKPTFILSPILVGLIQSRYHGNLERLNYCLWIKLAWGEGCHFLQAMPQSSQTGNQGVCLFHQGGQSPWQLSDLPDVE